MIAITEAELKALAVKQPSAIKRFEISEAADYGTGWFYLVIYTKTSKEPFLMTSMRQSARRWTNLNNAVKSIREFNVPNAEVIVKLNWPQTSSEPST